MSAPTIEVAKAFSHELRAGILDHMAAHPAQKFSPTDLASDFGEPLGNVSYHVKTLVGLGMVELVDTKARRGALEHYYALTDKAREVMA